MKLLIEHRNLGEISPDISPIEALGECYRLLQQARTYGWVPCHRKFSVTIKTPINPFGSGMMSNSQQVFFWEGRLLEDCMDAIDTSISLTLEIAKNIAPVE